MSQGQELDLSAIIMDGRNAESQSTRQVDKLSLGHLTNPDKADHVLTHEEKTAIDHMAKYGGKEAQDLMMKCPVAGKHLASQEKDKKEA